ncbi:Os07g0231133, partial [Oryza sativa Japonica Group]
WCHPCQLCKASSCCPSSRRPPACVVVPSISPAPADFLSCYSYNPATRCTSSPHTTATVAATATAAAARAAAARAPVATSRWSVCTTEWPR